MALASAITKDRERHCGSDILHVGMYLLNLHMKRDKSRHERTHNEREAHTCTHCEDKPETDLVSGIQ
eukprot:scaffold8439_cov127-Isochrysis_galbana.AAC.2